MLCSKRKEKYYRPQIFYFFISSPFKSGLQKNYKLTQRHNIHLYILSPICMQGKYEQASNYYKRAYELAHQRVEATATPTATSIPSTLSTTALAAEHDAQFSSCEYAISLAHGLLTGESEQVI